MSDRAPSAVATPLIACRGLTKGFPTGGGGRIRVLDGLDLSVGEGELIAVTGSSGVGKSTLLYLLGALEPPDAGSYALAGEEVYALDERLRARLRNRRVGFVFQFHHLLPEFSAQENVMMPLLIAGRGRAAAADRAAELLGEVGLGERLVHRPGKLSGGEQQRVAIARALALDPPLVLADEPTGDLDPAASRMVYRLFRDLQRRQRFTAVVVTHNPELAAGCDRVLRLRDGRLEEEGEGSLPG